MSQCRGVVSFYNYDKMFITFTPTGIRTLTLGQVAKLSDADMALFG